MNETGTVTYSIAFMNALRDNTKGIWDIRREPPCYDIHGMCKRCGDEFWGADRLRNLIKPGYHCWCDR